MPFRQHIGHFKGLKDREPGLDPFFGVRNGFKRRIFEGFQLGFWQEKRGFSPIGASRLH